MLGCCESENTLKRSCLKIIELHCFLKSCFLCALSLTSESNVCIKNIMMIIKQHLRLEIAVWKLFNNGYGKYRNLRLANSINADETDWTDWHFSVSHTLFPGQRNENLIFLTPYFSFNQASLKSDVKLAVIILKCEDYSCRGQWDEISFRPLEFTFCIMEFSGFSQDLHVKNLTIPY